MPSVAESNDFVRMLRFVVSLGADQGRFISDLKTFIGMRGGNRHVKAALSAEPSKLPSNIPHVIVGMILMAYTAPAGAFQAGYSRFVTPGDFRCLVTGESPQTATPIALKAERILRFLHCSSREGGLVQGATERDRLSFLASVDSCVCRFLCKQDLGNFHEKAGSLE